MSTDNQHHSEMAQLSKLESLPTEIIENIASRLGTFRNRCDSNIDVRHLELEQFANFRLASAYLAAKSERIFGLRFFKY
jgi:hypothetical protein